MDVSSLAGLSTSALTGGGLAPTGDVGSTPAGGMAAFSQFLGDALGALQQSHSQADQMVGALAAGQDIDLHQVMLALEHANLATQLAVQVRNKLVEAYQEISRMQV